MSAPPQTRLTVSAEEETAIRLAVRCADLSLLGPGRRIAGDDDVAGLIALLSDPAVSDPIYDLPRPFTPETIAGWIAGARARQARGEAILAVTVDDRGDIAGYSYFTVWPDRSAAEIAGAHRADLQGHGQGKTGAARSFGWMFEHLGVRLIGLTAALDNVRSARVIEAAGFVSMGQRQSVRADGTTRQSLYWELTRDRWRELSRLGDTR
ncbi:MAG: GNAT family N-acetyltransferase [Proteobacteria bacterium]|nr:GNAT family N-acetyltransferase [Pseudomonadota bacterium]MDE2412438.1 GNAT family N-acetyltransferase [Sphingomonadales bacterium]